MQLSISVGSALRKIGAASARRSHRSTTDQWQAGGTGHESATISARSVRSAGGAGVILGITLAVRRRSEHSVSSARSSRGTWQGRPPTLGGNQPSRRTRSTRTHYLYDVSPSPITPTDIYTVHFLEPITGFTLTGGPVATPGLNGPPGAAGSYGLYLTMQRRSTEAVGPPDNYHYLGRQVALMLDPGNKRWSGKVDTVRRRVLQHRPHRHAVKMTIVRLPPARWSIRDVHALAPQTPESAASETSFRPSSQRLAKSGFFVSPVSAARLDSS